jgi:hypothetical protein
VGHRHSSLFGKEARRTSSQRGDVALDALWGLFLGSMALLACAIVSARISVTASRLTAHMNGRLAAAKTISVVTGALRSLERNRQPFAAQIFSGSSLLLSNDVRHPLALLSGTSNPRSDSDIISIIDPETRFRGTVTSTSFSGTSVTATICGLTTRIPSGTFKSFLLYTVEGVKQVVGEARAINTTCAMLSGTSIQGVVSASPSFTSRPLHFAPVDREYSIFVDRNANLRLASHTGSLILENQPLTRGIEKLMVEKRAGSDGTTIWKLRVKPSQGGEISHFIVPALAQRHIWNEVLP